MAPTSTITSADTRAAGYGVTWRWSRSLVALTVSVGIGAIVVALVATGQGSAVPAVHAVRAAPQHPRADQSERVAGVGTPGVIGAAPDAPLLVDCSRERLPDAAEVIAVPPGLAERLHQTAG